MRTDRRPQPLTKLPLGLLALLTGALLLAAYLLLPGDLR